MENADSPGTCVKRSRMHSHQLDHIIGGAGSVVVCHPGIRTVIECDNPGMTNRGIRRNGRDELRASLRTGCCGR